MVTERKEPTVSSVLSSKDDVASKPSRRPISPQPQVIEKKISSINTWIALLLAAIAVGIAGMGYIQLMQAQVTLQEQRTQLKNQQGRIVELENQLALSDDESAQSLVAISARLKEANSEIRKLWGVSYDTNRKAIKANKTDIASHTKNYQTLNKTLQTQQMTLNNNDQRLSEQELLIRTLRERLDEQIKSLKLDVTDNAKRTGSNEEAIKAFDIFRRSVSRDLLQIKQQLKPSVAR